MLEEKSTSIENEAPTKKNLFYRKLYNKTPITKTTKVGHAISPVNNKIYDLSDFFILLQETHCEGIQDFTKKFSEFMLDITDAYKHAGEYFPNTIFDFVGLMSGFCAALTGAERSAINAEEKNEEHTIKFQKEENETLLQLLKKSHEEIMSLKHRIEKNLKTHKWVAIPEKGSLLGHGKKTLKRAKKLLKRSLKRISKAIKKEDDLPF